MAFDGVHEVQGVWAGESVSANHKGWVYVAHGNHGVRITIEPSATSVTMTPAAARRLASMLRRLATRWEQAQAAKAEKDST